MLQLKNPNCVADNIDRNKIWINIRFSREILDRIYEYYDCKIHIKFMIYIYCKNLMENDSAISRIWDHDKFYMQNIN